MIPAVVMAGGEGTRLRPLTTSLPKPLLPVLNRPMLEHVLRLLRRHEVTEVVITVAFLAPLVRSYTGDGSDLGMRLRYATEDEPLGTAGSVKNAEASLSGGPFLVLSGDAITDIDLTAMIEQHRSRGSVVTVGLAHVSDPVEYGGVVLDDDGRVVRLVEKPGWGRVVSDVVNTGIYVMEPEVLADLPAGTRLDWSADVIPDLLARGRRVDGFVSTAYWEDVGTLERYRSVQSDALTGRVRLDIPGFEVSAGVWMSEGAEVDPDATVAAPVLLGRNVKLEAGAVVRGPTVLGDNTLVRAGAVLQRCVVQENAYIGERAALHGCLVGRNVEAGRSARLEEGVVVGNDCVIEEEAVLGTDVRVFPAKTIEAGAVVRQSVIWEARGRRSLFGARGVTGILNVEITPELVVRLTSAFASTMPKGSTVVIARDLSRGARALKRAVSAALTASALEVVDLELTPLPVARHVTSAIGDAGIVVRTTPGEPESMDVLLLDGTGVDIDEPARRAVDRGYVRQDFRRAFPTEIGGLSFLGRAVSDYVAHVARTLALPEPDRPPVRVVVDAGGGAAALALPSLLGVLGADAYVVNSALRAAVPADRPGDVEAAMGRLGDLVVSSGSAFGVRFDSVAERLWLVDDRGQVVDDDRALLIMLDLVTAEASGGVVAMPVSATRVAEQVAAFHGATIRRTLVGAGVFDHEASTIPGLLLAGDGAGSFAVPAVAPTPDGLAAFSRLVSLVAGTRLTLGEIDERIPRSTVVHTGVRTPWAAKGAVMREVAAVARARPGTTLDLTDGIKVIDPDGSWFLMLPDPIEALMRVWAEAATLVESDALLRHWCRVIERAIR
jgi:mannose-1-phosphate guanylyltransferase/phosphomannomutase